MPSSPGAAPAARSVTTVSLAVAVSGVGPPSAVRSSSSVADACTGPGLELGALLRHELAHPRQQVAELTAGRSHAAPPPSVDRSLRTWCYVARRCFSSKIALDRSGVDVVVHREVAGHPVAEVHEVEELREAALAFGLDAEHLVDGFLDDLARDVEPAPELARARIRAAAPRPSSAGASRLRADPRRRSRCGRAPGTRASRRVPWRSR